MHHGDCVMRLPHGEDGELQVLDNPRDCGTGDEQFVGYPTKATCTTQDVAATSTSLPDCNTKILPDSPMPLP